MNEAERLIKLEERYVHLQRHIAEQDKAMLELGEELARVKKELGVLRAVSHAAPEPGGTPAEDRPPHY